MQRYGSVAQLNRASDSGSAGHGFESHPSHSMMQCYIVMVAASKDKTQKFCTADDVLEAMRMLENEEQRKILMGFFKTGVGQYGEGDKFLGLRVPETRAVVKWSTNLPIDEVEKLLKSFWHEVRLCGFLILVSQFEKAMKKLGKHQGVCQANKHSHNILHSKDKRDEITRDEAMEQCDAIAMFYVRNARYANNWDLVDMSCYKILGRWLLVQTNVEHKEKVAIFDRLAMSDNLWERRISMVSTLATTMASDPSMALKYAELHLRMFVQKPEWSHDLMHKAVGWMLREVGKRCDMNVLRDFLSKHAGTMPRTSLRYAIEQMNEDERKRWMAT